MDDFVDVYRAEKMAQDRMTEDGKDWGKDFLLMLSDQHMPVHCVWLDPFFGMFQVKGKENNGFMCVQNLPETAKAILL